LLINVSSKKSLTEQQKASMFMVFSRWVATMEVCAGIYSWYFPQVKTPENLHSEFHSIYSL